MNLSDEQVPDGLEKKGAFPTTPWSVILRAGRTDSPSTAHALERLCRMYWYPIYAFLRRNGTNPHDAEDLTQGFFAHLFEKNALADLGQEKGKFRSFLLAACTNYLRDERDKAGAQKRGGGFQIVSLDAMKAEECFAKEAASGLDPRKLFERRWAFTLINGAIERLKGEYSAAEKEEIFCKLEPYLTRDMDPHFYTEQAAAMDVSEGAVRVALHRMRRRFGQLLRSEVAYTVSSAAEIEEELRHLLAAIAE